MTEGGAPGRQRGGRARALLLLALLPCLLALALFAGCGKSVSEPSASSGGGGELRVATPAPVGEAGKITWALYRAPSTLDPIFSFDYPENTVVAELCDALQRQRPDGSIEPGLARMRYRSPTEVVLDLRPEPRFWDGSPVTAADVAYSLERHRDPQGGSLYSEVFDRVRAIDVTGPRQVRISLSRPDYALRGELSAMPGMVVQKRFAEAQGSEYGTPAGGVMCSGPYRLAQWKPGAVVGLVRNEGYWDPRLRARNTALEFRGIADIASLTSGLETGEIDGTYLREHATLRQLESAENLDVYHGPSLETDEFIPTDLDGPLGDPRVRRALSLAFDRESYVEAVYNGAAGLPRMPSNPGTWGFARDVFRRAWRSMPSLRVDLVRARQLVADAGARGKTIVIATSTDLASTAAEANAWQAAAKQIGLDARLHNVSADNYINFFTDANARAPIDALSTTTYGDYADPAALEGTYVFPLPKGIQNYSGWDDPRVKAIYSRAQSEPDPRRRARYEIAGQRMLMRQLPWIPVVNPDVVLVLNKRLTGAPASFTYMQAPALARLGDSGR